MDMVTKAVEIAARAHADQEDKMGKPYIFHPMRVMLAVLTKQQKIVAMLHDVVEDTSVTISDLKREGFSRDVLEAVDAMTRRRSKEKGVETYSHYLERVYADPIARVVKIADISDNMSPMRLYQLDPSDQARLKEKYQIALAFLEN